MHVYLSIARANNVIVMSQQLSHLHGHDYRPMTSQSSSSATCTTTSQVPSESQPSEITSTVVIPPTGTATKTRVGFNGSGVTGSSSGVAGVCHEYCTSDPVAPSTNEPVHPAAIALRLRVTQVVCGILTCVLGAVACIEEHGDFRLGTGVVAGAMTVAASIASIHATFNDYTDRARWIQYTGTSSNTDCSGQSILLSSLWAGAVISNMVMLAFVFMAFPSSNTNLIIIGCLELGLGVTILTILLGNLFLAVNYRGLYVK